MRTTHTIRIRAYQSETGLLLRELTIERKGMKLSAFKQRVDEMIEDIILHPDYGAVYITQMSDRTRRIK